MAVSTILPCLQTAANGAVSHGACACVVCSLAGKLQQVRLQLWDIAGQDRFAKLTRAYFRRAKGAVVVCDVTREGTFDAIVRWKVIILGM